MASLLDWIGKRLHGIEAQLNPWDNGENYQSVVNGGPRYQSQPAKPQQPVRQPVQSPSGFSTGLNNFETPAAQVEKPKIDINANANLSRQQQQKQPQNDVVHELEKFAGGVGNFVGENVVKPIAEDVSKAYNTVQAPVTGLVGAGMALADKAFNGGKNYRNLVNATNAEVNQQLNKSFVPQNVARVGQKPTANPLQFGSEFAQTGVKLAPYVLNPAGGLVTKLGANIGGRIASPVLSSIANKASQVAASSAISAPVFASLDAVNQGLSSGFRSFDPGQSIQSGLESGIATGIGGGVNALAGRAPVKLPTVQISDRVLSSRPANYFFGDKQPVIESIARQRNIEMRAPQTALELPRVQSPASSPASRTRNVIPSQETTKLGMPQLPEMPVRSLPNSTRQRGFAGTVSGSREVTPQTKSQVRGTYDIRNTQELDTMAQSYVKNIGLSKAGKDVSNRLNSAKPGTIDDRTVAEAIATAKAHDANGDYGAASDIYNSLSEHLTKSGQTIQAASLLNNMTPEGLRFRGLRELKRAGVEVTPEIQSRIKAAIAEVKKYKPGTEEHNYAVQSYGKVISDNIPSDRADKLSAFWKAGLLTGLRTQTGNALSNATFAGLRTASDPLAALIDRGIGMATGQRTKTFTLNGRASGAAEGLQKGARFLKTGVDELNSTLGKSSNKFDSGEVKFKNKAANAYVNGVFRLMGAADKPFRYAQLRNSLNDLAKADGMNKGLRGNELTDHIKSFVENPPKEALQRATNEAAQAVLANDTLLSNLASRARSAAESVESPVGKFAAKVALNAVAPFTKVPSAFISRVFDYTPVGAIKTAASQISKGKLDQRALATALSEATTGTSIIYLGAQLANNGMLSGNYPDDPKEHQRWKAQGIQPNSIKVGDQWLSLNYFGPLGALFSQGKRAHDTLANGGNAGDVAIGFAGGGAQDALGQSFLQGVSGAMDAISDPERYAKNFVKNQAGSVVPTLSNDIATAIDPMQRQSNSPLESIQARLPVLRQGLKTQQDVYGNELSRKSSAFNTLINPLRPSSAVTNDVKSEVERLHNVDTKNKDLQVTPTTVDKTLSIDGKKVKLSDDQVYSLQKQIGQSTQSAWSKLIKSDQYKKLSDADKANALDKLRGDVAHVVQSAFAKENNLGKIKLSNRQSALASGNASLSNYTSGSGTQSESIAEGLDKTSIGTLEKYNGMTASEREKWFNSNNDAEYKYNLAKYNNDKASGSISSIENISRQKSLQKEKVGASYQKSVRDLYGLSKADTWSYLNTDEKGVDKNKMAQELIAYDKALYDAGLTSYLKYKNGLAPAAKKSGGRKGRGKKSSGIDQKAIRDLAYKSKVPTYKQPPKNGSRIVELPTLRKTTLKRYSRKSAA